MQSKVGSGDHLLTVPAQFKLHLSRLEQQLHLERDGIITLLAQALCQTLHQPQIQTTVGQL